MFFRKNLFNNLNKKKFLALLSLTNKTAEEGPEEQDTDPLIMRTTAPEGIDTYINNWENVKAYVEFICRNDPALLKDIREEIRHFDRINDLPLNKQQEKIKQLHGLISNYCSKNGKYFEKHQYNECNLQLKSYEPEPEKMLENNLYLYQRDKEIFYVTKIGKCTPYLMLNPNDNNYKKSDKNYLFLYKEYDTNRIFYYIEGDDQKCYLGDKEQSLLQGQNAEFNSSPDKLIKIKYNNKTITKAILNYTSEQGHTHIDKDIIRRGEISRLDNFAYFDTLLALIKTKNPIVSDEIKKEVMRITSIGDRTRENVRKINQFVNFQLEQSEVVKFSQFFVDDSYSQLNDKFEFKSKGCDLFLMLGPNNDNNYKASDKNHLFLYKESDEDDNVKIFYYIKGDDQKQYLGDEEQLLLQKAEFNSSPDKLIKYDNVGVTQVILDFTSKGGHVQSKVSRMSITDVFLRGLKGSIEGNKPAKGKEEKAGITGLIWKNIKLKFEKSAEKNESLVEENKSPDKTVNKRMKDVKDYLEADIKKNRYYAHLNKAKVHIKNFLFKTINQNDLNKATFERFNEHNFKPHTNYQTAFNWTEVQIAIAEQVNVSKTLQHRRLDDFCEKMIEIIRSGATDITKWNAMAWLIDRALAHNKKEGFKRLQATILAVKNALFTKDENGWYFRQSFLAAKSIRGPYVNSWKNVNDYLKFELNLDTTLTKEIEKHVEKEIFFYQKRNPDLNPAEIEEAKITALADWVKQRRSQINRYPSERSRHPILKRISNFLDQQVRQTEAEKLSYILINNSPIGEEKKEKIFSYVKTNLQENSEGSNKKLHDWLEKNEKNYSADKNFNFFSALKTSLFYGKRPINKVVEKYETAYDWGRINEDIKTKIISSGTEQTKYLKQLHDKMMLIFFKGTTDEIKIDSLKQLLNDYTHTHRQYKYYKQLYQTIEEITLGLFKVNEKNYSFDAKGNKIYEWEFMPEPVFRPRLPSLI